MIFSMTTSVRSSSRPAIVGSVIRASWHAFINGSLCAKDAAALPTMRLANPTICASTEYLLSK
ncbi:Uncharacterised protein [Mycobacteroides abscessus subsp. massiliense]|nr:Uncharacterised protein [Mycobacteroides abscessus subsp. massiliense]